MKRVLLFLSLPMLALSCKTTPSAPSAPVNCPQVTVTTDQTAAKIGSTVITLAEVDKAAGSELYELRKNTIDQMLIKRIVEPLAKAEGVPVNQYLMKQAEARIPQVSEAEALQFFTENQSRLPPQLATKKFDEVKDMIINGLTQKKRQESMASIVEDLKKKANVVVLLEPAKVEVAADGPAKGPKDAKVTIVEFSDFQCPYCSKGKAVIDKVVKTYGDKVRVVFRDFPLEFHQFAQKAAEAGQCANEQGKFWQMHDWMFAHQDKLSVEDLKAAAKEIGLDATKFDSCLTSGKFAKQVADNMSAGQAAGVRGTPAFFINGVFLNGAQPFEAFQKEIDRELARH